MKGKVLVYIQVSGYVDVEKRALELGYEAPTGLTILPRNFDTAKSSDELIHEGTTSVVRSLLQQAGVQEAKLEKEGEKFPHSIRESWEWIGPLIFVSQWILTNATIPVTINMISSYLYDIAKGHRHDAEVTLEFVEETVEKTKRGEKREYKRIAIKGSPGDLKAIDAKMLKQLMERSDK
ncbi:MAG TPA: hypothetical protein VGL94_01655 [Ktedonobacteraceae bacterium]|jgi:hypothetical protein